MQRNEFHDYFTFPILFNSIRLIQLCMRNTGTLKQLGSYENIGKTNENGKRTQENGFLLTQIKPMFN